MPAVDRREDNKVVEVENELGFGKVRGIQMKETERRAEAVAAPLPAPVVEDCRIVKEVLEHWRVNRDSVYKEKGKKRDKMSNLTTVYKWQRTAEQRRMTVVTGWGLGSEPRYGWN